MVYFIMETNQKFSPYGKFNREAIGFKARTQRQPRLKQLILPSLESGLEIEGIALVAI